MVERGWHAHVLGEAPHKFTDAVDAVKTLRVRRTLSCHIWPPMSASWLWQRADSVRVPCGARLPVGT